MKTEILEFAGAIDQGLAMNIARVLQSVRGVSRVAISTEAARVTVDFDDDLTSPQELRTLVQRAGLAEKVKASHAERGMCCGSCGG